MASLLPLLLIKYLAAEWENSPHHSSVILMCFAIHAHFFLSWRCLRFQLALLTMLKKDLSCQMLSLIARYCFHSLRAMRAQKVAAEAKQVHLSSSHIFFFNFSFFVIKAVELSTTSTTTKKKKRNEL